MSKPIMARATAVWLIDNSILTFKQIAQFCDLHELEVQSLADGDDMGILGSDPVANNQLDLEELRAAEKDPERVLRLKENPATEGETARKAPRYTPLSKRYERPAAIAWLVKNHPELNASQISKLVGTTKPTIQAIRDRTHWNIGNIQPTDPVALGLCRQTELDDAVRIAAKRKEKATAPAAPEGATIKPTEETLRPGGEPKMPSAISGLEDFKLGADT